MATAPRRDAPKSQSVPLRLVDTPLQARNMMTTGQDWPAYGATGKTMGDRPLGTARANGPFGIPSLFPFDIGTPNNGGPVITAGGLVFIAAATDNVIRAIDIRTGETLWQDVLPGDGQANPLDYEHRGREFVVIYAGGHHFMETPISDHVVAYALPLD